jgi:hypothetical protein
MNALSVYSEVDRIFMSSIFSPLPEVFWLWEETQSGSPSFKKWANTLIAGTLNRPTVKPGKHFWRHYRLVTPEELTEEELKAYQNRPPD